MAKLNNTVAVITGAGQGLGRAHAMHLARLGATVVVNDVANDLVQTVVADVIAQGGQALSVLGDVSDPECAGQLVAKTLSQYGKIDVLINNAGILRDRTLRKMSDADWNEVLRVHLHGTFLCTKNAIQPMIDGGIGGSIINTTSVSGMLGNFGQANYAAAKAGIYGLTRTAAIELKKYGIRVNAIAPIALTQMTEHMPFIQERNDAKQHFSPAHVSPVVAFLASSLSSDVTGHVIAVEGPEISTFRMIQTTALRPPAARWTMESVAESWRKISQQQERSIP